MKRCTALLLFLLLAGLVRADGWALFTAPDDSFSIEFPDTPTALPSDGRNFGWQSTQTGAVYVAGYSVIDGLSEQSEEDQSKVVSSLASAATKPLQNVKRRAGTGSAVELAGTDSTGKLVQFRLEPAPEVNRIYVMKTIGQVDAEHFFTSFQLLGQSDEGGD